VDEILLGLQHRLDRFVRRLRRGAAPVRTDPRLLIVQIDGLSHAVLERALAAGRMPFLAGLLTRRGYRLEPMSVGLPTSTPAFQMAAMYGVRPDIPGFHYYDRADRTDIHFPRPGHAARVEARQAAGRRGILEGGSAYGCVFTGGAENNLFSFARLWRPTGSGLVQLVSAFVVLGWVIAKCLVRTVVELTRAVLRLVADPVGQWRSWRWLTMQLGLCVWLRSLFTLGASRDLYLGAPAVYVNYLDYDVAAHAFGPRSRRAFKCLARVDRAIRQLMRVTRRVPEHRYELYVLADHGQTGCTPYREIAGGRRFERWIFDEILRPALTGPREPAPRRGLVAGLRDRRRGTDGLFQHFVNYVGEDFLRSRDPEAHQEDGVRVISAGPNGFLYVLDAAAPLDVDALERRLPGVAEEISRSPGVGFVLARSADGPVCFWRGKRALLSESEPGPFGTRTDRTLVVRGLSDLMAMPSAGDLVIYGIDAPEGHVSFISERGAHAGPAFDEMRTFIVYPPTTALSLPITHPIALYDHFIRYCSR
jgi:hypothetical protein